MGVGSGARTPICRAYGAGSGYKRDEVATGGHRGEVVEVVRTRILGEVVVVERSGEIALCDDFVVYTMGKAWRLPSRVYMP